MSLKIEKKDALFSKWNSAGPYNDLYIYHIKGRVDEIDEQALNRHFIGNWVEDNYSFLFFSDVSYASVSDLIKRRPDLDLINDYHFTYEEWQGGCLTTIRVGDFVIMPPWEDKALGPDKIGIIMDPGVVFGTGLHPTTRDCLKALSYVMNRYSFEDVLDIGTGTGILAIAAALLGAERVLALDLNPLSVKTAKNNVKLNGLDGIIKVVKGKAEDYIDDNHDIVLANIHYEVVKKLLEIMDLYDRRYFIFSGLMRSQTRDIRDMMAARNLIILKEWDHEMTWYTFVAGKG